MTGPAGTAARMGANRYGKDGVRLVAVRRHADRHELRDLTVELRLEGDFAAAYTAGDNSAVLPTDTMRTTVYALAREHLTSPGETADIEAFGQVLGERLLTASPAARRAEVTLTEHAWTRLEVGSRPHPHAFAGGDPVRATAEVTTDRDGPPRVVSGLTGLAVLKTTGSSFSGFLRDDYTVLADADDRILATDVAAHWAYGRGGPAGGLDYDGCRGRVRDALLASFATHDDSRSVQHTLYVMGSAALAACPEVESIHLRMPNRHHLAVDLAPFGQDNPGEVFVATDRPYGVIEGTVERAR